MFKFFKPRQPAPIFVCSMDEAGDFSRQLKAGLLVSISDPERRSITTERLGDMPASICPLDFHDIERPAPGMAVAEPHHIQAAIHALQKSPVARPVLVHCHAGISRSSAVALLLATARHIMAGKERDEAISAAFSQISMTTPHARPNMHIIEIGTEVLKLSNTNFIESAWNLHRGL